MPGLFNHINQHLCDMYGVYIYIYIMVDVVELMLILRACFYVSQLKTVD